MRVYLNYIDPFSKREPFYELTESLLRVYRLLMSYRLQYTLSKIDSEDESIGVIVSFLASHYGFITLTGEYFREPTLNLFSPGEASRKADIFAITNMSAEISWLTLSKKLISCDNRGKPDDISEVISQLQLKQQNIIGALGSGLNFTCLVQRHF